MVKRADFEITHLFLENAALRDPFSLKFGKLNRHPQRQARPTSQTKTFQGAGGESLPEKILSALCCDFTRFVAVADLGRIPQ